MKRKSEALVALEAGILEADRRARGEFDGLIGSLPKNVSQLLSGMVEDLRDVLLGHFTDEEARQLLDEYKPALASEGKSGYRNLTNVPDDVELALRLLNLVASANACAPERRAEFLFGKATAKVMGAPAAGGEVTGKLRAAEAAPRHEMFVKYGRDLLADGIEPHNIASMVARKYKTTPQTVRPVLRNAGVIEGRKKGK